MLYILFWILVGVFIGWCLPQPIFAMWFQDLHMEKIVDGLRNRVSVLWNKIKNK